jgi:multicomponent Na+:H+ antiporter subunit E
MLSRPFRTGPGTSLPRWRRLLWPGAIAALVWLGLNGDDLGSWLIGAPVVVAAAALGGVLRTDRRPRLRWRALLPFAAFFLRESLRGGWDVAWRVLHPRLPISPGFIRFGTALPEGPIRNLFVNVVSLLPGTVASGFDGDEVIVHALDVNPGVETALRGVERRVAKLFVAETEAGA